MQLSWIVPILMRNVLACWVICGFWDWFLYLSPWQKKLAKFKVTRTHSRTMSNNAGDKSYFALR